MRVIDDLAAYQQNPIGAATKVAAANPAGGIAAGGIGVGMGMAMAGRLRPAQTPAVPQAPPPPVWHVVQGGQATGPFTLDDLSCAAAAGALRGDTLVWTAGMASGSPAAQVPQLAGIFAPR